MPLQSGIQGRPKRLARAARFGRELTKPDRLTAFLEQGLLAATRMGALLVFARIMPTELFGAFALVVSISFILNQLQRSVVVLPFIRACQKADAAETAIRQWWWIDLIAMGAVALILLGAWAGAAAFGAPEWVRTALLFSAIAAPPLMLYTFHRRLSYQVRDHCGIVVMVLIHIVTYAFGVLAVIASREMSVLPFLAFAMAPAAGALVGIARIFRVARAGPPPGLFGAFRASISFTKWSFLGGLVGSLYTNGMNIIVAGVVGAAGSAAFAATRTMVAPIVSLTSATDMIDKPRASRAFVARGLPGLRGSVLKTLATLVLLGAPYLMLVTAFSGEILEVVYGPKYAGLELELRFWALAMLLNMIANPLNTHLTTLGDTRSVFHCNLLGALVALAIALPLLGQFGVLAALVGMACGRLVNVALLYHAIRCWPSRNAMTIPRAGKSPARTP